MGISSVSLPLVMNTWFGVHNTSNATEIHLVHCHTFAAFEKVKSSRPPK